MTTIYLIRHSKKMELSEYASFNTSENSIVSTEKIILDVEGEKMAETLTSKKELNALDSIYTSNCVRTIATAKYICKDQNIKPHVDEDFDERRVGIPNDKEYPDWFFRQFKDHDFKTVGGEGVNDVYSRFKKGIKRVLNDNKNKRVAVFAHGNAIVFYLLKILDSFEVKPNKDIILKFNNKEIFNGKPDYLDTFKLLFDDNNKLSDITFIKYNDMV